MQTGPFLLETFEASVDPRLTWSNPPPRAATSARGLLVETAGDTDLWQRTHYGFCRDNAHALRARLDFDFRMETSVALEPVHQYDQAGLLVWISEACWLKTSIEFEPEGENRLGSVVTNAAFSDWATQDIPRSTRNARFRISRRAGDYLVEYGSADGVWSQLRILRLHEDDGAQPIWAGLYACSPKRAGFRALFEYLRIEPLAPELFVP